MSRQKLELELIHTQMTQKPMLRVEVGARALRNQTGGGGGRVQRSVGALAQVCVSGPQNRKRSQEGINPPSELSRSLFLHNHGAAGGDLVALQRTPCRVPSSQKGGRYNPTRCTQQGSAINGEEEGLL